MEHFVILKGHNLDSGTLLAVKTQEMSLLTLSCFLYRQIASDRQYLRKYLGVVFASWSVDLLNYTQIKAVVLSWLGEAWR